MLPSECICFRYAFSVQRNTCSPLKFCSITTTFVFLVLGLHLELMAYFVSLIIICAIHNSVQFKIHVTECPDTAGKWNARSSLFICGGVGEEYHCLQDVNKSLIETCMIPFHIKANKSGCPWIHIKDNGSPIIGYPMHNCSTSIPDCPEENHENYSSNEIYKYPHCIRTYTFGYDTSTLTTSAGNIYLYRSEDEKWKVRFFICIGVLVVLAVLVAVLIIIVVCLCRRKRPREYSNKSFEMPTEMKSNSSDTPLKTISVRVSDSSNNGVPIFPQRTSDSSNTLLAPGSQRTSDSSNTRLGSESQRTSNSSGTPLTANIQRVSGTRYE